MVVNETLETYHRMRRAGMLTKPPAVFLNRATMPSLTDPERGLIGRLSDPPLEGGLDEQPALVPPAGAGGVPREVVGAVAAHLGRTIGVTRRKLAWT